MGTPRKIIVLVMLTAVATVLLRQGQPWLTATVVGVIALLIP